MSASLETQTALISIMVFVSAADRNMTDAELFSIGEVVRTLPAFDGFAEDGLVRATQYAARVLESTESLDQAVAVIKEDLPPHMRETAYVLACDIAAADGTVAMEEMRALELIRYGLELDRLTTAAIERAARARFAT